ncbi:transporter substrate-binding domain-containing protein [Endozoicomonas sp. SM1973]|uniref:Transporter substrate-binding domain-containing protein n=1 Tax=Spartinivicinus marinus TaxID=2994442 RepID=A0A853I6U8_9GAMM|nr:transporter substrate-binding domain-containing protein [Spartinivicinus marinus]MCX4029258.1 transporter substrate-binding domain-containing protein [Spartinivicinus marinus]NYZ65834.1 transporter substrate-binding domain-containing protein [Spartinivicinus marinus]
MIRAIIFLLLYSYLIPITASNNALIITQITDDSPLTNTAKDIIRMAYQKLGINIHFLRLPAERSLVLTNQAVTDGELFRIDNINLAYPNLIKVPTPYLVAEHMAFSKTKQFTVKGWESVKPYRICFRIGYKVAEHNTRGFNIVLVNTNQQALHMLNSNRVEVVILDRLIGLNSIQSLGFKDIKMLTPPLQTTPLFHYLHKKHKKLVPKLNTIIQEHRQGKVLNY